jgi:hypothetical protein
VARRSVRDTARWRQLPLPGWEALLAARATATAGEAGAAGEGTEGVDWEEQCFQEGCAYARRRAQERLAALEAHLHATRPAG